MRYHWFSRLVFWYQKKKYGDVLAPAWEWGKAPWVMGGFLLFYRALTRKSSPLSADLRALVAFFVAQSVSCVFCMRFNAEKLGRKELTIESIRSFHSSSLFTDKEKSALAYARMMVKGEVDHDVIEVLRQHFSEKERVELTAFIGCQLLSSRFNLTLGVQDYCKRRNADSEK